MQRGRGILRENAGVDEEAEEFLQNDRIVVPGRRLQIPLMERLIVFHENQARDFACVRLGQRKMVMLEQPCFKALQNLHIVAGGVARLFLRGQMVDEEFDELGHLDASCWLRSFFPPF